MGFLKKYLKKNSGIYLVFLLFYFIFISIFLLYHIPLQVIVYPTILCIIVGVIVLLLDLHRIKQKHEAMECIDSITDIVENEFCYTDSIEDEDYKRIINLISEEYKSYCTDAEKEYLDMVDYYTVWVHQIKTPIASIKLNLQNEDSELARKLRADLYRIEQYVEMVLTFLRLNSESSDYVFKEYDLDTILKSVIKKFSHDFITRKIGLNYESIKLKVVTDEKWFSFVIEQILSNALKYTKSGSITISLDDDKKLHIKDTGIGIAPEDLPRIFEKGYTGFNGRTDKKASGIGLYLCKRICLNLGHNISAKSVVDEGTIITIDLAQQRFELE